MWTPPQAPPQPPVQFASPPGHPFGQYFQPPPGAIGPPVMAETAPRTSTAALPDPKAIARQKDAYAKLLDDQLKQSINVLEQQVKYQREYLVAQCEQQKQQFLLQLDQQMKAEEMALSQQYNEQLMSLQMQANSQKAALEQQAMQLTMEYEQRKAEESMSRHHNEIERQQQERWAKMNQEAGSFTAAAPPGGGTAPGANGGVIGQPGEQGPLPQAPVPSGASTVPAGISGPMPGLPPGYVYQYGPPPAGVTMPSATYITTQGVAPAPNYGWPMQAAPTVPYGAVPYAPTYYQTGAATPPPPTSARSQVIYPPGVVPPPGSQ